MVPSIVISSFLAVISFILPPADADEDECSTSLGARVSAVLNAFNTILLGLAALMKFQSRMEAHTKAASECRSLSSNLDQLESKVKIYFFVEGSGDQLASGGNDGSYGSGGAPNRFMKDLVKGLENIDAKLEEIAQMVPLTVVDTKGRS